MSRSGGNPVREKAPAADGLVEELLRGRQRILRFLERRVGSRDDADDLLQTALLKVVAKAGTLRDEQRLLPWFYRILRNEIADYGRRRAALARVVARLEAEAATMVGWDESLFRATCDCLSDVLMRLSPQAAEVIRRLELEQEPLAKVAERLRISRNTASVRLHRARKALRRALLEFCRLCATHARFDCGCGGVPVIIRPHVRQPYRGKSAAGPRRRRA